MTFRKNDQGKPRFGLIPPEVELEVAKAFTYGANKYSDNNYRKGTQWSRYVDACRRHMNAWQMGQDNDEESGLSHLAHAIASLSMLFTLQLTQTGEDDRWTSGSLQQPDQEPNWQELSELYQELDRRRPKDQDDYTSAVGFAPQGHPYELDSVTVTLPEPEDC